MTTEIMEREAKIYYIGGSPCSGKSTIAQKIAKEHNLFYFPVDESLGRYASMGEERGFPACSRQWKGTPDEIWLRDIAELCEQELQFYREIFIFIQEDLRMIEADCTVSSVYNGIITEGAAFLPELMYQNNISRNHYICMTPTEDFQNVHYRQREWVSMILNGCSDKETAFKNWMKRDVLFAEHVRQQCVEYGYPSVVIDEKSNVIETIRAMCEFQVSFTTLNGRIGKEY